tara:strand:+ start:227 stop:811 length:585 start_codon:yes stop_codon:yes gene_type:complete
MSKELDFLETFFQTAIDKIVDNLSTMKDSKGHNRFGSGVTAQEVGQPDNQQITEYASKWVVQIYMPYYYEFIDEGVSGWANEKKNTGRFKFKKNGRPIPREAILSFMRNRGIVYDGFQDDKKKRGVKSKQTIKDKLNQLAYIIGRSIKRKGTEGVPFYSSVMTDDFFKSFETNFLDVYGDKVLNDIEFVFKNKT